MFYGEKIMNVLTNSHAKKNAFSQLQNKIYTNDIMTNQILIDRKFYN